MAKKKSFVAPGIGPLFPGKKYQPSWQPLPATSLLKKEILRMSALLGPDHPNVKMLKKDLERRGKQ